MVFPEPDLRSGAAIAMAYQRRVTPEVLQELDKLPDPDAAFAKRLSRLPVVLARIGVTADGQASPLDPASLPVMAEFTGDLSNLRLSDYPKVVANLPTLDGAAAGHGAINGSPDADGRGARERRAGHSNGQEEPESDREEAILHSCLS